MDTLAFLTGDSRFFWPENIKFFINFPLAWDSSLNTGLGISQLNTLFITSYLNFTSLFSLLGISWPLINLIFWMIPIIIISFLSSFFLFKITINKSNLYSTLAGIIFASNTYFLSIFLGGQMGVSFAYVLIPFVLIRFIKLHKKRDIYNSIFLGLALLLQILFDPRITALTTGSLIIFYIINAQFLKKDFLYFIGIPGLIIFLTHSYWVLPLIVYKPSIIPQGFDSLSGVKFLSFAFLENSFSLLHPNWPDNIFGKVDFMRTEFLVLPILAYSSLLFFKPKLKNFNHRTIIFFALLGLIGAFLAKGTNEPFGNIYIWLFENVPGFNFFRDSTKFYMIVALSYSILLPFSLWKISERVSTIKYKVLSRNLIFISFILFWLFSLRLLFTTDIFKIRHVPESYVQLKNFIVLQNQFFRTFWIPSWQRYGYFSNINPAIGRGELSREEITLEILQNLSVKYVIVPEDSEDEIFLDDRRYSEKVYKKTIQEVEKIRGLKKIQNFGKTSIYEVKNPRDHFWSPDLNLKINYKYINPTKYEITVKNAKKGDILIFSESFDPYWTATNKNIKYQVSSIKYDKGLNSFILPKDGNYTLEIYYKPQKLVNLGLIMSGLTFILVVFYLIRFKKR